MPNTSDAAPAQEYTPSAAEISEFYQELLSQRLMQLRAVDLVVQDMRLLVDGSAVRVKNKSAFKENIKSVQDFIQSVVNEPFINVDAPKLQLIGFINHSLLKHLIAVINNHMTSFPAYDFEQLLMRHTPIYDISFEQLETDVINDHALLALLTEKSKTAGLRWYNTMYRMLNYYVIQPGAKHKLHIRGGIVLGAALLTLATVFATDYALKWDGTDFGGLLENKHFGFDLREGALGMGWFPKYNGGSNQLDTGYHDGGGIITGENGQPILDELGNPKRHGKHGISMYGHLNKYLIDTFKGYNPIPGIVWGAMAAYVYKEWDHLKFETSKKMDRFHRFMMGGVYNEKSEKLEDKFLVNPRVTFKDLVGLEYAKETLSFIVQYMEKPEAFDRCRIPPNKGYILTGPTRTGKSFLVEALAGEIKEMFKRTGRNPDDFNFFSLTANFIMTEGIDNIIARAKEYAPCVLFIDELDLLNLQRSGNSELLSRFLTAMSGVLETDPDKAVIMMAATNKPENIEKALIQHGRFGKEIRFEYPSFKDRKIYLTRRLNALANVDAFDVDKLARETEGKSFEQLNTIIKTAFQKGIMRRITLTNELLEQCHDEEVRNIIMATDAMPPKHEQSIVAAHQAGQALIVMLLNSYEKLAKATTKPYLAELKEETVFDQYYKNPDQQQKKIRYGKIYTFHDVDSKNIMGYQDTVAQCKIQLAGFAAEQILSGHCSYSYNNEAKQNALGLAKKLACRGLDISEFSDSIKAKYQEQALQIMEQYEKEVYVLLEQHKDQLKALADALLQKQTLTGIEVAHVVNLPEPYKETIKSDRQGLAQIGIMETAAGQAAPAA